jgi:hypothetical protein
MQNPGYKCKQYLQLGKAQNTDFYEQTANSTIILITCTILTLYKLYL